MRRPGLPPSADFIRRFYAAGTATLVLALSIFAASPVAHEWLHDANRISHHADGAAHEVPTDAEAECPIEMFATGISVPLVPPAVAPAEESASPLATLAPDSLFLASPRYLLQPERGPPMMD